MPGEEQQELRQLESLCEAFYAGPPAEQKHAHSVLLPLATNPRCVPQLQAIIANSEQPSALMFATNGLNKLFTSHWSQIGDQQKTETRAFLLDYLYRRGPVMLQTPTGYSLLQYFVRLFSRIVKLSWLENIPDQNIVDQVSRFLEADTIQYGTVGFCIYTDLCQDMQPTPGTQMARLRRTSLSFRDQALPEIFKTAIRTLQEFHSGMLERRICEPDEQKLLKQALQLTLNCLSFDFMGNAPDESVDENLTTLVMIPASWKILKEENIPKLLFELYCRVWQITPPRADLAQLSLQSLVLLAAIRRSFLSKEEERSTYIQTLIQGTTNIIANRIGLESNECFHELCRLLGKINAVNQLSMLSTSPDFQPWLSELFQFSIKSLENWRHLPNSKHYLLGLWSSMADPLMFLRKRVEIENLENYIHQVTLTFINTRMLIAEAVATGEADQLDVSDPLEDDVMRYEQFELLLQLGRCRYADTATHIANQLDMLDGEAAANRIPQAVYEMKVTWCVYIIAAIMGGHTAPRYGSASSNTSSSGGEAGESGTSTTRTVTPDHVVNGGLAAKVFHLMQRTDALQTAPQPLELAYLYFLEQFRKVFMGEHAQSAKPTTSGPDERLCTLLGLKDEDDIVRLMVNKIGSNLQHRVEQEQVIKRTLSLFYELSSGVNIIRSVERSPQLIQFGRLLLRNDLAKYILANHQSDEFGFLNVPKYGKYRTIYYQILSRLLFIGPHDDFNNFMAPMAKTLEKLMEASNYGGAQAFRNDTCRPMLVALARDVKGVCLSCNSPETYSLLFDWLVNVPKQPNQSRIHIFTVAADVWWDEPKVVVPILKLFAELGNNKMQRIMFDQASASGVLLFKEISSVLTAYGSRILTKEGIQIQNVYKEKYKGVSVALEMFSHSLAGNYTNFGVFEVYNDLALANALELALQMCLTIPEQDLQAYLKCLKPYYTYLELATKSFMPYVLKLDNGLVAQLLHSVEDGLCSFYQAVWIQCCNILDNVVSFIYTNLMIAKGSDAEKAKGCQEDIRAVMRFVEEQPQSLKRILQLALQLIVEGQFGATWSVSRPLLALILLQPDEFRVIKQQLAQQQTEQTKREKMESLFDMLMRGIDNTLSPQNKDAFTRNLYNFSQACRSGFP
eukprot:GHVN01078968.1.p1 GENE.GHVN01078968.1~~GHVN01078968.1.p1  ORF type:complete len:1131 (+),score=105.62 GHVN01078968.1:200-3592(+)